MDQKAYDELREELLEAPYRVVDFLPRQVSAEAGGRWFKVERYLLERPQIDELYRRFARLVLKLSCYYGLALYEPRAEAWQTEPGPEELAGRITACAAGEKDSYVHVLFPAENALLTLEPGDLCMTLYGSGTEPAETARLLAAAEGLFLREPEAVPDK